MNSVKRIRELEQKIGYRFKDFNLLVMAMRHSSYVNEHHMERLECNERLEFLGDAVLEVVSSEFLYGSFPELPEGELTKKRASMVCEPALHSAQGRLNLGAICCLEKEKKLRAEENVILSFLMRWKLQSELSFWMVVLLVRKSLF